MGRKPKAPSGSEDSHHLRDRIARLAELVWAGRQSQMARDLGVAQSSISKVLAGKQQPGTVLLERLATWTGVNPVWLVCGRGEPLAPDAAGTGAGHFRPILVDLDELLAADPSAGGSGASYPVPAATHSPTTVWYRVPPNTPLAARRPDILTGDLLLVETDSRVLAGVDWANRLAAFRLGDGRRKRVVLGAVGAATGGYFSDDMIYPVDFFGNGPDASLVAPADFPAGEPPLAVSGLRLTPADVAGVVVRLERLFGRRPRPVIAPGSRPR
ncbi:MAG: helix-turn-helix domain-containing protein [Fimbriiglobus sp.]